MEFYDTIKNVNGMLRLTIPKKMVEFYPHDLQEGRKVKVLLTVSIEDDTINEVDDEQQPD